MGAERSLCIALIFRHSSRRDGPGAGHRLSRHRESSDQNRRLSPRHSADWHRLVTPGILPFTLRTSSQLFQIAPGDLIKTDILTCEHCGGAVKVQANIEDPAVIKKILEHLDRRTELAPSAFRPFARAPPSFALPGLKEPG